MKLRKLIVACVAIGSASSLALGAAPTASAGLIGCGEATTVPFLPWLDVMPYTLVPNGGFESGSTGWRLSGGASVSGANEPFFVRAGGDSRSLVLPSGASAVSPPICVGLGNPTLRFFSMGATPSASLRVDVLYPTLFGTASLSVPLAPGAGAWAPSLPLPFLGNVLSLTSLGGLTSNVQFRFTAKGGAFGLDDIYVDPMRLP